MKKILIYIPVLLLSISGFAQKQKVANDTTRLRIGNSSVLIIENDTTLVGNEEICEENKDDEDHVGITIDFGVNGFLNADGALDLDPEYKNMELDYARSRSFGFHLMYTRPDSLKRRIYVSPGFGITWNGYRFRNNINIASNSDTTMFLRDTVVDYDKYKLRTAYLEVPLIVGARIGNMERPVQLQVGVIGGFRIGSMIKQKYTLANQDYKTKVRDDFNTNPFKFDALVRIGFGDTFIYGRYSLTSLFEKDKALQVTPFSIGITFSEF